MTKYLYTIGATVLALGMSGLPTALAHADEGMDVTVSGSVMASTSGDHPALNPRLPEQPHPLQNQERLEASTSASTTLRIALPGEEMHEGAQMQEQEGTGSSSESGASVSERLQSLLEKRMEMIASSSEDGHGNATSTAVRLRNLADFAAHMDEVFGSSTPAQTLDELKANIQEREQAVQGLVASSSPGDQSILDKAGKVSVAVHAILAARDLMGSSTGQAIADIAEQVNNSLSTTTAAEAQIQARGFWQKLFFGGDSAAAQSIQAEVTQNQDRIKQMTDLLNQASTTAEVKAELQAQIQQLEETQATLSTEAKAQANLWGLFSWRLF